jgi:hypothetical protein
MSKKQIGQVITMAKAAAKQSAENGNADENSPELMDAIQAIAAQIKEVAGENRQVAALIDQVQALAKDADKN